MTPLVVVITTILFSLCICYVIAKYFSNGNNMTYILETLTTIADKINALEEDVDRINKNNEYLLRGLDSASKLNDTKKTLNNLEMLINRVEGSFYIGMEAGVIYGPAFDEVRLSDKDLQELEESGWVLDEESRCWKAKLV